MTTTEKITLGVAIAGALGLGALLQVWVTHLLQRRERQINIADKSVQIAEALMTRMEAELTRAQEALVKAQQESEELRTEQAATSAARREDRARVVELHQKLQEAHVATARGAIDNIYGLVLRLKQSGLSEELAVALAQSVAATATTGGLARGRQDALTTKVRLGRIEAG